MINANQPHQPQQRVTRITRLFIAALLLASSSTQVFAQTKKEFRFVNVADTTQGLHAFSEFAAINDLGSVVFEAIDNDGKQGVFKWRAGAITTIVSESNSTQKDFADAVINATDVVAYAANPSKTGNNRAIFTSDGVQTKTIVDAKAQGIIGRFLGSPSINDSGRVAFFAFRTNSSQAVVTGDGGALTLVADASNSPFIGFGNPAINNSGRVTFVATGNDDSVGVFIAKPVNDQNSRSSSATFIPVTDPQSPIFNDPFVSFGDPVINDAGVVANSASPSSGNLENFTGNGKGVTPRTDVNSPFFTSSEHPSLNNRGTIAFIATELGGGEGIFVETTGGASPVAILEAGDPLFGSTVTLLKVGRFALNNHQQLAFRYDLQDGRSGVAIVFLHGGPDDLTGNN
jgi:hypothetical protein